MNERLLRAEMVMHDDDLTSLARGLKISRQTLTRKIYNRTFTQSEMIKIKNRYNLNDEKFNQIFMEGAVINEG